MTSWLNDPFVGIRQVAQDDSSETCAGTFDRQSRLHSINNQPSLVYSDGTEEWHWHGVSVPKHVICEPHLITAEEIDNERNIEIRRVMIERYPGGPVALMQAQGAHVKHKDEYGELWTRHTKGPNSEALIMLKVKNSSPEPDGTFKDYWLRVPPAMRTAREAVAWTFSMHHAQYKPEVET